MFKYIDLRVFLVTLAIGMLYIYISDEYKHTIIIYPTPDNISKFQYKDHADNCFTFDAKEVNCKKVKSEIKKIPVQ
jgi:hypothetical protein